MNEIHLIKNLHFDKELRCDSYGKAAKPFMNQGDRDDKEQIDKVRRLMPPIVVASDE